MASPECKAGKQKMRHGRAHMPRTFVRVADWPISGPRCCSMSNMGTRYVRASCWNALAVATCNQHKIILSGLSRLQPSMLAHAQGDIWKSTCCQVQSFARVHKLAAAMEPHAAAACASASVWHLRKLACPGSQSDTAIIAFVVTCTILAVSHYRQNAAAVCLSGMQGRAHSHIWVYHAMQAAGLHPQKHP